jgi:hypothetical protein
MKTMNMEISYEDWKLDLLTYDDSWIANCDTTIWELSGELTYMYVTRFFSEGKNLLNDINPEELNRILWLLIHDVLNVIPEEYPPLSVWKDYFAATKILFRDIFNCYCAPVLGHKDEQPTTPLNSSCYMWWDIVPVWHPDKQILTQIQQLCLETIIYCLKLDNLACKESALHGLGHWYTIDSHVVKVIIQNNYSFIPDQLQNYSQSAICGCVL